MSDSKQSSLPEETEHIRIHPNPMHHRTEEQTNPVIFNNTRSVADEKNIKNRTEDQQVEGDQQALMRGSHSQMVFQFKTESQVASPQQSSTNMAFSKKIQDEQGHTPRGGEGSQVSEEQSAVKQFLHNVYQNASQFDYDSKETNMEGVERQIHQHMSSCEDVQMDSQDGITQGVQFEGIINRGSIETSQENRNKSNEITGRSATDDAYLAQVIKKQLKESQQTSVQNNASQEHRNSDQTVSEHDRAHIISSQQNNYKFESYDKPYDQVVGGQSVSGSFKPKTKDVHRINSMQSDATRHMKSQDLQFVIMKKGSQEAVGAVHSNTASRVNSNQVILKDTNITAHGESVEEDEATHLPFNQSKEALKQQPPLIEEELQREDSPEAQALEDMKVLDMQHISRHYPQVVSDENGRRNTGIVQDLGKVNQTSGRIYDSLEATEQADQPKSNQPKEEVPTDRKVSNTGSQIPSGRSDLMSSSQNKVKTQQTVSQQSGAALNYGESMNPNDVPFEYTVTMEQSNLLKEMNPPVQEQQANPIEESQETDEVDQEKMLLIQSKNPNVKSSIELVNKQSYEKLTEAHEEPNAINVQTFRDENLFHTKTSNQEEAQHLRDILTRNASNIVETDEATMKEVAMASRNETRGGTLVPGTGAKVSKQLSHNTTQTSKKAGASGSKNDMAQKSSDHQQTIPKQYYTDDGSQVVVPDETDTLLHRLPNNYFIQDEDEEDLDQVIQNIENMRSQMMEEAQRNQLDHSATVGIANIQEILQPQKFIQKHYPKQAGKRSKNMKIQSEEVQVKEPQISTMLQEQQANIDHLKKEMKVAEEHMVPKGATASNGDSKQPSEASPVKQESTVMGETVNEQGIFEAEPPKFLFEEVLNESPSKAKANFKEQMQFSKEVSVIPEQKSKILKEEEFKGDLSQIDQTEESMVSKSLTTQQQNKSVHSRNVTSKSPELTGNSTQNRGASALNQGLPIEGVPVVQEELTQNSEIIVPRKDGEAEEQTLPGAEPRKSEPIKVTDEDIAPPSKSHDIDFWAEDDDKALEGEIAQEVARHSASRPEPSKIASIPPDVTQTITQTTLEEQQLDRTINSSTLVKPQDQMIFGYNSNPVLGDDTSATAYENMFVPGQGTVRRQVLSKTNLVSGPRIMKMADYFKGETDYGGQPYEEEGPDIHRLQQAKPQSQNFETLGKTNTSVIQARELTAEEEQRLEKEVLDNVDINFLFSKGQNLMECLIDAKRVFTIVEKIKDLAKEQLAKGSKDIDYEALVDFLKRKDNDLLDENVKDDSFAEPEFEPTQAEQDDKWNKIIVFMRNNPKLLMQMIPDGAAPDLNNPIADQVANTIGLPGFEHKQTQMVYKRSRLYDKIYEAQQWQQLQKLSQNFTQSRKANAAKRGPPQLSTFLNKAPTTSKIFLNEKSGQQLSAPAIIPSKTEKPWKLAPLAQNLSPENQIRKLGYYHGKNGPKQVPPMALPADLKKIPKPQTQQQKRKRSKPRPVKAPQSQISHDINAVTSPHSDYRQVHQSQSSKRSIPKGEEITITEEHPPQINSQAVSQMEKPLDADRKEPHLEKIRIKRRPSHKIGSSGEHTAKDLKSSSRGGGEKRSLFNIKSGASLKRHRKSSKTTEHGLGDGASMKNDSQKQSLAADLNKESSKALRSITQKEDIPKTRQNNFMATNSTNEKQETFSKQKKKGEPKPTDTEMLNSSNQGTIDQPIDLLQKAKNYQISDLMSMNSKSQIGVTSEHLPPAKGASDEYMRNHKLKQSKSQARTKTDHQRAYNSTKSDVEKSLQSNGGLFKKKPGDDAFLPKPHKKFVDITNTGGQKLSYQNPPGIGANDVVTDQQQGCINPRGAIRFKKQPRAMTAKATTLNSKSRQVAPPITKTGNNLLPLVDRGANASQQMMMSNQNLNTSNLYLNPNNVSNISGARMHLDSEKDTSIRNSKSQYTSGYGRRGSKKMQNQKEVSSQNLSLQQHPKFIKPVDFSRDGPASSKHIFYKPCKFNPLKKTHTQNVASMSLHDRPQSNQGGARLRSTSKDSNKKKKVVSQMQPPPTIPKINNVMMFQSISDHELLKTQKGLKPSPSPKRSRSRSRRKKREVSGSPLKKSLSPTRTKIISSRDLKIVHRSPSGNRKSSGERTRSRKNRSPISPLSGAARRRQTMQTMKIVAKDNAATSTTELQIVEARQFSTKVQKSSIYDQKPSSKGGIELTSSVKNSRKSLGAKRQSVSGSKRRKKSSHSGPRAEYRDTTLNQYGQTIDDTATALSSKGMKHRYVQEMSVQTDIRGVEHKIMVQPDKFDSVPYAPDPPSDMGRLKDGDHLSQNTSYISDKKKGSYYQHYKVPVINWTTAPIFGYFRVARKTNPFLIEQELNSKNETTKYSEVEVDSILDLIKNSYSDFKRTDIMKPFYMKALDTLKFLLYEQTITPIFERVREEYKEVTLENTMKLLIRCKLAYNSRNMLITLFQYLDSYYTHAGEIKDLIENQKNYKVNKATFDQLRELSEKVLDSGVKVLKQVNVLKESSHRQFKKKPFIYQNTDIGHYVRAEVNQIRRLVYAFKIKKEKMGYGKAMPDDIQIINQEIEGGKGERILMISKSGFFEAEQQELLDAPPSSSSDDEDE